MSLMEYNWSTLIAGVLIIATIARHIRKHISGGTYNGQETMVGKTVVITGANTGLGKETVKDLAMRGARIIMGCRDLEKGKQACQEIIFETQNTNIENRKLDLGSFASIRAFAKSVLETESKIDVLINNAGVALCPRALTENGLEQQLGVNHFGHFLLTNLLLDKMKASAPSRIINVSSLAHKWGRINFDDLQSEKSYSRESAYYQSKVANILHALELSKRLKGTGVTANSLNPGAIATDLQRHITLDQAFVIGAVWLPIKFLLTKTLKEGVQTSICLAVDPKLKDLSGKYFSDCVEMQPALQAQDEAIARRLWKISEAVTKKSD